ncbi:unnamed protein product [Rhizophagus irregularis]|nr:unnamed protein product [Rhizophagus irregularis]
MHEILMALWFRQFCGTLNRCRFCNNPFLFLGFGSTFQSEDLPALLWKWLQQFFCENEQEKSSLFYSFAIA